MVLTYIQHNHTFVEMERNNWHKRAGSVNNNRVIDFKNGMNWF